MKKWFPISAMATNVVGLVVSLVIYAALSGVFGWLTGAFSFFLFEIVFKAIFAIVGVYSLIGAIVSLITFFSNRDK